MGKASACQSLEVDIYKNLLRSVKPDFRFNTVFCCEDIITSNLGPDPILNTLSRQNCGFIYKTESSDLGSYMIDSLKNDITGCRNMNLHRITLIVFSMVLLVSNIVLTNYILHMIFLSTNDSVDHRYRI